jgi:outer membrane immunogenic protein
MQKVLCASIAALAVMLAPAVAVAADLGVAPIYKAPPAPTTNWGGSYIGLSGGGVWGRATVENGPTGTDVTPAFNLNGGLIGVTTGAQLQNGQWVLGYESDTSITSKKGGALELAPNVGLSADVKERWLSTYRGRIGVAQDNWLFYATAGGALASVQHGITTPAGGQIGETHWHWGWAAGAGVEWKVSREWSAKMEYLYVGLQDKSYFNPNPVAGLPSDQRVRLDDHLVRVGVNYKLPWSILDGFYNAKR